MRKILLTLSIMIITCQCFGGNNKITYDTDINQKAASSKQFPNKNKQAVITERDATNKATVNNRSASNRLF